MYGSFYLDLWVLLSLQPSFGFTTKLWGASAWAKLSRVEMAPECTGRKPRQLLQARARVPIAHPSPDRICAARRLARALRRGAVPGRRAPPRGRGGGCGCCVVWEVCVRDGPAPQLPLDSPHPPTGTQERISLCICVASLKERTDCLKQWFSTFLALRPSRCDDPNHKIITTSQL